MNGNETSSFSVSTTTTTTTLDIFGLPPLLDYMSNIALFGIILGFYCFILYFSICCCCRWLRSRSSSIPGMKHRRQAMRQRQKKLEAEAELAERMRRKQELLESGGKKSASKQADFAKSDATNVSTRRGAQQGAAKAPFRTYRPAEFSESGSTSTTGARGGAGMSASRNTSRRHNSSGGTSGPGGGNMVTSFSPMPSVTRGTSRRRGAAESATMRVDGSASPMSTHSPVAVVARTGSLRRRQGSMRRTAGGATTHGADKVEFRVLFVDVPRLNRQKRIEWNTRSTTAGVVVDSLERWLVTKQGGSDMLQRLGPTALFVSMGADRTEVRIPRDDLLSKYALEDGASVTLRPYDVCCLCKNTRAAVTHEDGRRYCKECQRMEAMPLEGSQLKRPPSGVKQSSFLTLSSKGGTSAASTLRTQHTEEPLYSQLDGILFRDDSDV